MEPIDQSVMIIVAYYSHNNGLEYLEQHHPNELEEVFEVIKSVPASRAYGSKHSLEKNRQGRPLYAPKVLNRLFSEEFEKRGWTKQRIEVQTVLSFWKDIPIEKRKLYKQAYSGSREMDFVKHKVGVEVQFGKYAFMVYNVAAKMTIFAKKGVIKVGIEIVPMKRMADQMSTGVSYFEQMKTDLEMRGVANIDIPVLVLGIDDEV